MSFRISASSRPRVEHGASSPAVRGAHARLGAVFLNHTSPPRPDCAGVAMVGLWLLSEPATASTCAATACAVCARFRSPLTSSLPRARCGASMLERCWRSTRPRRAHVLFIGALAGKLRSGRGRPCGRAAGDVFGGAPSILRVSPSRSATAPPARTALILASEPAFAGLFGWLLNEERLTATGWVGAALIMAAIVSVEIAPRLRPPRPLPEG